MIYPGTLFEGRMTVERRVGGTDDESEDIEVEVFIQGRYQPADPKEGIFRPWFEDVFASDTEGWTVSLTEDEEERAQEVLLDAAVDWGR